ncbi:tRNA (adenosine(37)-N6)-threonylcarbamoyltransferase complex dimerization subunit type 1 TsaB [Geoalkalibacter sp.]|uniref:tRNA (adenosine(37)-N6)-threonylcarbamoyltransferase complex dimerization subunit type 1 TsaB n=1 Tax=Geoalkalibacter sp. TaxID=3041440 RepID=UPI00272DD67A|nr:tRNA (adenosine(37)-N6)-threonylcarbamoyltransferase complex dimerization subunit type 1 TsaB [Geoalkalibacter sp.]
MTRTLLAIDTATSAGSVALCRDETLLGEILFNVRGTHSERLMATVRQLLVETGLSLAEVDAFAVVHGPGSFTGLRVGMASAQGLALATGRPVIGVSSLQVLAMNLGEAQMPVCALLDARKQEVYAGLFRMRRQHPQPLGPEQVIAPAKLLPRLEGPLLFVGEGARVYRVLIEAHFGAQAHFAPWPLNLPRASMAAALALERLRLAEDTGPHALKPAYIRASEAEISLNLKQLKEIPNSNS